jgi:hypothetical protein
MPLRQRKPSAIYEFGVLEMNFGMGLYGISIAGCRKIGTAG